jgi:Flp pilus assembly protein TadG
MGFSKKSWWSTTQENRMLNRLYSSLSRDVHGSSLVETAVALPVILLLMTGIFSFSIALHQKLTLAEAVSNGGRVLASERGDTDPCAKTTSAIYAAAPTLSQSNMTLTYTLNGVSEGTGTTSCSGTTNMVAGGNAEIVATYPISISVYGKSFGSFPLTTQITEVVQ